MFERYTEKARRVIFFARYEASQLGSPYIETEHLLLGVLREANDVILLFEDAFFSAEGIRKKIEERYGLKSPTSVSLDLPLSNESKRVLAYAAEEAERMRDKHIGAEHLFLGLLRESGGAAAQLLNERGVTLPEARKKIAGLAASTVGTSTGITYLHGIAYRKHLLDSAVSECNRFAWQKRRWTPRDLLVDKEHGRVMFYGGETFDPVKFQLTLGGWSRDHCAICSWPLYESPDPEHGIAYTNGRDWICTECHDKFFSPPISMLDDLYT